MRTESTTPVSGFILAGERSRRMGTDKAVLEWRGRTLLDHMTALLSEVTDSVRIVGRSDMPDRVAARGPLGGIATALVETPTEHNIILAVGLPLLGAEFLGYFRHRLERTPSAVLACSIEESIPLCLGLKRHVLGRACSPSKHFAQNPLKN